MSYNNINRSAIIFIYLFSNRSVNKKLGCNLHQNQQLASCAKPKTKITPLKPITKFQICGKNTQKKKKKSKTPLPKKSPSCSLVSYIPNTQIRILFIFWTLVPKKRRKQVKIKNIIQIKRQEQDPFATTWNKKNINK